MTPRPTRVLDRRQMLRLTGLTVSATSIAVVTGCSDVKGAIRDLPRPHPHKRADNEDEPLLASARADQEELLALCVAVRAAHPDLASALDPVVAHHRTQVTALGSGSGTPATRPTPDVPGRARRAAGVLLDAERAASH
ncbi:MAG: hypothetical protein ACRDO8_08505, partial [Nocardioidaceae bacterium]